MKVLHATETAKGGVGTYLDELIPLQIVRHGQRSVRAILPAEHRGQLPSVGDDNVRLFSRQSRSLSAFIRFRTILQNALEDFQPDVLHLHSTFAGAIGRLAIARQRGCKIVYNPHGWAFEMWPRGVKRNVAALAERHLARRCDIVLAVSEAERHQALAVGVEARKVAVVKTGIASDYPRTEPAEWNDARLRVLFVGRLDRQKGIDTLAVIASKHIDELALRIIGDRVVSDSTADLSASNVRHLGWQKRTEVDAQIQACDVLVMPSRWEAFGITALEAMRAAKPVVAFSVGGLTEVITDGVTGRLVPAGDIDAFEQALLFEPRERWREMGASARRRFEKLFTAERMADQISEIYDHIWGRSIRV